jgi:Ring finger domain
MRGNRRDSLFAETREALIRLDANRRYMIEHYDDIDIISLVDYNTSLHDLNNRTELMLSHHNGTQSELMQTQSELMQTLFNSRNNSGFEMVTTISTTSPGSLPTSLFDALQNIVNMPSTSIGYETQEDIVVPLPPECIKQMPSKKYKSKDTCTCSICFNDFKINERYRKLPCNHQFHKRCIDKWFNESVKCPMCRQDLRDLLQRG